MIKIKLLLINGKTIKAPGFYVSAHLLNLFKNRCVSINRNSVFAD